MTRSGLFCHRPIRRVNPSGTQDSNRDIPLLPATLLFDAEVARGQLMAQLGGLIGTEGANAIEDLPKTPAGRRRA
jgi:hypothetical protein